MKDLRDAHVKGAKQAQELKTLSEKDKRTGSVIEALETRIENMKLEIFDFESKVATTTRELSSSQVEDR